MSIRCQRLASLVSAVAIATALVGCGGLATRSRGAGSTETEQPAIDFRQVIRFARMADVAYLDQAAIEERFPDDRIIVRNLPLSGLRYFVRFDDKARRQDIAIRGTSNLANIRVDVEFTPNPDPKTGIHLHQGFGRAADELYADLKPLLRPKYATTITGHSLGGAAAAIIGMRLVVDRIPVRHVVTFGQPKITNVAGAKIASALPILRVVNRTDPVAEVPPLINLVDSNWVYTHFGPEIVIDTDGTFEFAESHRTIRTAILSFWRNLGTQSVDAHRMTAYLVALEGLVQDAPSKPQDAPLR